MSFTRSASVLTALIALAPTATVAQTPRESYLQIRSFGLGQSKTDAKYKRDGSDKSTTIKDESWFGKAAYPSLEFQAGFDDKVVNTTLETGAGAVMLGKVVDPEMDVGAFVGFIYQGDKTTSTSTDGSTIETGTASKAFFLGPYVRMYNKGATGRFEGSGRIGYVQLRGESGDTIQDLNGIGLALDGAYVVPLHKSLSYVAAADISYVSFTGGEIRASSGKAKFKSGNNSAINVYPLGFRYEL